MTRGQRWAMWFTIFVLTWLVGTVAGLLWWYGPRLEQQDEPPRNGGVHCHDEHTGEGICRTTSSSSRTSSHRQ
jgi:hypothetical protein